MRPELLREKANQYAPFLTGLIHETSRNFYSQLVTPGHKDRSLVFELLTEELFLQLHVIDRLVFGRLGSAARDVFMDGLVPEVSELFASENSVDKSCFMNDYNARQKEYSSLRSFVPEGDESARGTLFWEFAKKQCALISQPINPANVMRVQLHEINLMGTLALSSLLDGKE